MKNNITSILRKNLILKRSAILSLIVILAINLTTVQNAATLEEALATGGKQQEETTQTQQTSNEDISNEDSIIENNISNESLPDTNNQAGQIINNETSNQQGQSYINGLQQIDLTQTPDSQAAQIVNGVNKAIYKTQSFIVQIIAYALTIMLTLRTLFDLTYIAIPFSRSLIDRISGQPGGNMGQNMRNMGGQSFEGQSGQFNQPPAASGATGSTSGATRVQLISDEARAAIQSPRVFRTYAKSMAVILIATTVMLVLALTGALTDLGFIIGKALTAALGKVKIIL